MASGCVWGIDIGKSALKAVRMREGKDELEILALVYLEYEIGEDGEIGGSEASAALEELLKRHPEIKKERTYVARPGNTAFSRFIKLPTFDENRLDEIVTFEAQQQMPFPIDDVVWGFSPIEAEEGEETEEREVGIFAIKKDLVYGYLADLQLSGLDPDGLVVAPLATYNFVRTDVEYAQDKALVVLDIGWDKTDLLIIDGEHYWLRSLTLSGREISKAIGTRLKKKLNEAEDLKREAANAPDEESKKVYQAAEVVLKDFVAEIQRSIGFYKNQNKGRRVEVGEVLLLGNGSKLASIRPYFQRQLGLPVKTLKRLSALTLDEELAADAVETLREQLPAFGVAFGLAIQACGYGLNDVNLLPKEIAQRKKLERKKPLVAVAVGLLFVTVILAWMVGGKRVEKTQRVLATAEKQLKTLRADQAKIDEISDLSGMTANVKRLAMVVEGRNRPLELMNLLAGALPEQNGKLHELTAEQVKQLQRGNRQSVVDEVLKEIRPEAERLNDKKLWVLETGLKETRLIAGKVAAGVKVTFESGEEIPVDPNGYFRAKTEKDLGTDVLVKETDAEGNVTERMLPVRRGVQATVVVAKKYGATEAEKLTEIEKELLKPLQERLPESRFDGIPTQLYGLELGKTTAPAVGFGGAGAVQRFLAQRIVIEHPDRKTLVDAKE